MSSSDRQPKGLLLADTQPWRRSKLFPGLRLVHGDFHNHTLLSDGAGDPARAFDSMRRAGLDVAAITDHALYPGAEPVDEAERVAHGYIRSLTDIGWRQIASLAEQAQEDGAFVALRGFEWTSPRLGHLNVWFSTHWIDGLSTGAFRPADASLAALPPTALAAVDAQVLAPVEVPMQRFYDWLRRPVEQGGGSDGLVGFNHPGREPDRFGQFHPEPRLRQRVVSMEIFNRHDDYLLRGVDDEKRSPLVECLDAGWKVGLVGVSDDHSAHWGFSDGYGRTGLWVRELTRDGVREALQSRRVFATRQSGLRLDAAANGVRMGGCLCHAGGDVRVVLDIDPGRQWWGKRLNVQVLGQGAVVPSVKMSMPFAVPRDDQPPIQFDVALAAGETRWLVLRVSDPLDQGSDGFANYGRALAYSSPFFLDPAVQH